MIITVYCGYKLKSMLLIHISDRFVSFHCYYHSINILQSFERTIDIHSNIYGGRWAVRAARSQCLWNRNGNGKTKIFINEFEIRNTQKTTMNYIAREKIKTNSFESRDISSLRFRALFLFSRDINSNSENSISNRK